MPEQTIKCNRENCSSRGKYPICRFEYFYRCNLLNRLGVYDSSGRSASQIPATEFEIRGIKR